MILILSIFLGFHSASCLHQRITEYLTFLERAKSNSVPRFSSYFCYENDWVETQLPAFLDKDLVIK